MKYGSAAAFRAALEQRLKNRSQETGASLMRLRKAVVFDRFLARLLAGVPDRWVVKGALALDFRLGDITRTTKDIDLVHQEGLVSAEEDLIAAQEVEINDFFELSFERVGQLGEQAGNAVRYRARAELAGRLFDEVLVDIGVTEPLIERPEMLRPPGPLDFAEIPSPEVPTLPLEQHIAEKVHAYTRIYGEGLASTRAKDLVDLVLVESYASPRAAQLREALVVVFEHRGLQEIPASLPPPPADWRGQYRKLAEEVGIEADLSEGHRLAAEMIDPALSGDARGRWDGGLRKWK